MTYDLRRLRLHGLIPHTHRYRRPSVGAPHGSSPTPTIASSTGLADVVDLNSTAPLRRALDDLATQSGLAA